MNKFLSRLETSKDFRFLLITSLVFFLLRFPSLFEPYWYGDEGIYQVIGLALRHGRILYSGIWDNKPPLLYMLYALFNSDQFSTRLVSLFFGLFSTVIFYFLSKKLFADYKISKISTALFAFLFAIPLIEGNIANAENFMMLPILCAGYLIFKKLKGMSPKAYLPKLSFFVAGVLLGLAFLFKIVAVFDFVAFATFVFIYFFGKNFKKLIELLVFYSTGFATPIFLSVLFFAVKGGLSDFIHASFAQNVGYVGYGNSFIIPQGFLILKLILLTLFSFVLLQKRKKLNPEVLFILIWFAFSLFNAFFSGRPYTHYVLVLLPSFCLLTGLTVLYKKERVLLLLTLATLILLMRNFTYFGKTAFYYQNFISFMTGKESLTSYQTFFDQSTPKDYEIAQFLKPRLNSKDSIFVWGNDAEVYVLTNTLPPGRYTVEYHINASAESLRETKDALQKTQPRFVIINSQTPLPFNLYNYKERIMIENATIYERFF